MATQNKKTLAAAVIASIYDNTTHDITGIAVQHGITSLLGSMSVNITVAQLQAEDDSVEHSLANIIDAGKRGIFYYDAADNASLDDGGGGCIVTSTGKRFKRIIDKSIDARWYGQPTFYFNTIADATTAIKAFTRFEGLEVTILLNGTPTTYWFSGGTADGNLITKSVEVQVYDFYPGSGAPAPNDGDDTLTYPGLQGAQKILGFWVTGKKIPVVKNPAVLTTDNLWAQWDQLNYQIKLFNGTFVQDPDSDYSLMFK